MGVQNATLLVGGIFATSGGTSIAFVPNGASVTGGTQLVDSTNTNAVTRASITPRTIKEATLNTVLGQFDGKVKRQIQLVRPKVLSTNQVKFPLIRIELEFVPENTDAEIVALLNEGAQLCTSPHFTAFWKIGSQA